MPIYIKIPDIPGEVTAVGHENEIEILSFSWGVAQSGNARPGTGRPARLEVSDLSLLKNADRASAPLLVLAATGKVILQDVILTSVFSRPSFGNARTLTASLDAVRYILKGVTVSAFGASGSSGGDDRPAETLSLNYAALRFEYVIGGKIVNAGEINPRQR